MTNLIKFRGFMPLGAASETHSLRFIQYCIVLAHCRAESDDEENGCNTCNTDLGHTALPGTDVTNVT